MRPSERRRSRCEVRPSGQGPCQAPGAGRDHPPATPGLTINSLFHRQVLERGEAIAVKDGDHALSYNQVNALSCALARVLRERGVVRGDVVVIYSDRTAEAVIAVIAVLKAGAAFAPVSLDTPPARLTFILGDADPRLVLTDRSEHAQPAGYPPGVSIVEIGAQLASRPGGRDPNSEVGPGDLAYIIYTSGTSGEPKGVMIEHDSIARRFQDWDRVFHLSRSPCRCLQLAKIGFDVFIADVVKALCSGGLLVICPDHAVLDPAQLYRRLVVERIDYVDTVPAVLRNLVDHMEASALAPPGVSIINCGADLWTKEEFRRAKRITQAPRLFNGYGLTECAVESTLFEDDGVSLAEKSTLPIGQALASDEILILDETLEPVAPGVTGQICIGGPCVARGYLNRSDLNRSAFFYRQQPGADSVKYYKTRDLGRVDERGVFEFLGRMDSQVKIRGQRIELEEVERVLEQDERIERAVVCRDGEQDALIAFVRTVDQAAVNTIDCVEHLACRLPRYMIPGSILQVSSFPLSLNGKIDREALVRESAQRLKGRHKPGARDLYESEDIEELTVRLDRQDIDLLSLVNEFVKPSAEAGVLIDPPARPRPPGEPLELDLLVLLHEGKALKHRRQQLFGSVVRYLDPADGYGTRVSLVMKGLRLNLDFLIDPEVVRGRTETTVTSSPDAIDDVSWRGRFRERLADAWIVSGEEIVERWRTLYDARDRLGRGGEEAGRSVVLGDR